MGFKHSFISASLSLMIKMDLVFEMLVTRNGKKFQEIPSLDN